MTVIERMSTYPQLSFPFKIQKLPAPRIGGGQESPEQRRAGWRRQAEYLTTINLSAGPEWTLSVEDAAAAERPGDAGHLHGVRPAAAHAPAARRDRRLRRAGVVRELRRTDPRRRSIPKTARVTEYPIPTLKPDAPTGILGVRFDKDENVWLGMQFQGGIAKFDRKTETFQTWSLPPDRNGPHVQINQVSPDRAHVDGKVWLQDAGTYTVLRLDVASGAVRRVRAVQDSAAERLRRDSRFAATTGTSSCSAPKTSAGSTRRAARSRSSRRRRRAPDRGAA